MIKKTIKMIKRVIKMINKMIKIKCSKSFRGLKESRRYGQQKT